jgi:ABC-2 type transport system permease protein
MGLAATGNWLSLLAFSSIFITVFALMYVLLSATFFSIITQKRTGKKAKYVKSEGKTRSAFTAILWKEGKRFVKTPMILFNAGLGSMLAIVFAIYALVSPELCAQIANAPIDKGVVASIVTVIVAFIATTNVITASSVSLEGESLWVLRSMPVSTLTIFKAKVALHVVVTAVPLCISMALVGIIFHLGVWATIMAILLLVAVTLLTALSGLAINLKLPNLKWTSEIVAVKQSVSVLVAMFVGWAIAGLVLGGNFLFGKYWHPLAYLAFAIGVLTAACAVLWLWLKKQGVKIFENLN